MSLTKQVALFSVGTDAFYSPEEQYIHNRLLKLYKLRNKPKPTQKKKRWQKKKSETPKWKLSSINRVIKKEKAKLSNLLDIRLESHEPRQLNSEAINDKNVVTLFESALTRALGIKTNELTKDIMIVNVFFFQVFENLVRDGFMFEGEKYRFLTASAGQIRTKRAVFIKESAWNKIAMRMMCGLTIDKINEQGGINPNKLCSYLALNSSATDPWPEFDIDKAIVVDDFESPVHGEVDYIDDVTYEIQRKVMDVDICHTDGMGLMNSGTTRMARLVWVKGLMVQFPFREFIKEYCPGGECVVYDIYGDPHKIIEEDIQYIFTKSQFKLAKYYANWDEYKYYFKLYNCEACYCNMEEAEKPLARINYQMLQTLSDFTDDEIQKLIARTVDEIDNVAVDYQLTMRLLGADDLNINKNWFQKSLAVYPELFRDQYCRDILKETKKSLVKQAKAGRLRVNGIYRFAAIDPYAFCQYLFLGEIRPKGLLENGEVYVGDIEDGKELACLRSPHLYREWPIRKNKRTDELDRWLGSTKCVYVSCHDLITKIVQADFDGDCLLVVQDKLLVNIAKRNMEGIVPLAYKLEKSKGGLISNQALYEGMVAAYTGGNIGIVSNQISRVWNLNKIGQEEIDTVKRLCYINNQVIDFAKTGWKAPMPKEVEKVVNDHIKGLLPNFFIYAKDKLPSQVEPPNQSTMNRIAASIPSSRLKFNKNIGKFDYRMLMNLGCGFTVSQESQVVKSYEYWNNRQYLFNEQNEHVSDEDLYKYHQIKARILEENSKQSVDYIVNTLVAYLYTTKITSAKKTLWACFGEEMYSNLIKNLEGKGKICPECGKRFAPVNGKQVYCGEACYQSAKKRRDKIRQ